MVTQADVDRIYFRKPQLETELLGTTAERKREIEAELEQMDRDLAEFARDQRPARRAGEDERERAEDPVA